jgi:hypothetical protein
MSRRGSARRKNHKRQQPRASLARGRRPSPPEGIKPGAFAHFRTKLRYARYFWTPRLRITASIVAAALLALLCMRGAYHLMFGMWQAYDDEGYMLSILAGTSEGYGLYDQTYSQYGPGYNFVFNIVFGAFQLDYVHDTGRSVTLVVWGLTSVLAGWAASRHTGSSLIGLLVQVIVFWRLTTLVNEPMHPIGLIALLLSLAYLSLTYLRPDRRIPSFALGAAAALLVLLKINVGLFLLVGLGLAVSVYMPARRLRGLPRSTAALAFITLPALLLLPDAGRVGQFLALCLLSSLAVAFISTLHPSSDHLSRGQLRDLCIGLTATSALILLTAVAGGTSWTGLLGGLILEPLQQRTVFSLPIAVPVDSARLAAASALVALLFVLFTRRGQRRDGTSVALVRVAAGLLMALAVTNYWGQGPFTYALPLVWIAALPMAGRPRESFLNLALSGIAMMQVLHVYPVAGSQTTVAAFLLLPLAASCTAAGIRDLWRAPALTRGSSVMTAAVAAAVSSGVVLLYVLPPYLSQFSGARDLIASREPLNLPGAKKLRLDAGPTATIREITATLKQSCSSFYTLPGLNSYYVFAEQRPPTRLTATSWMFLLDEQQQQQVVDSMRRSDRPCWLRDDAVLAMWLQGRPLPDGALVRYLAEFAVKKQVGTTAVLTPRIGP